MYIDECVLASVTFVYDSVCVYILALELETECTSMCVLQLVCTFVDMVCVLGCNR